MFGFGKVGGLTKDKYGLRIRQALKAEIGIETDSDLNPMFPGFLRFADLISQGWHRKLSAEFNALAIAISYLDGASTSGEAGLQEARRVLPLVNVFVERSRIGDNITQAELEMFRPALDQVASRLG